MWNSIVTHLLMSAVLDEGAGDGGSTLDAPADPPADPPAGETKPAVLDDTAAPQQAHYTVEQFLTQFDDDTKESATAFAQKFADKNGNISLDKMAKSGYHLEKQFGGFTGAPETYEIKTPDYMEGDVDASDPYIKEFMDAAKAGNMSQEMFENLMDIHLRASLAPPVDMDALSKEVGTDFDAMRANMAGFYKQKLEPEQFDQLNKMINSADAFKTLYAVFQASRPTKIEDKVRENFNQAELEGQMEAEYNAVDDFGNPKMRDPAYAKAWRERWEPFINENA